jgi:hypothetical protein
VNTDRGRLAAIEASLGLPDIACRCDGAVLFEGFGGLVDCCWMVCWNRVGMEKPVFFLMSELLPVLDAAIRGRLAATRRVCGYHQLVFVRTRSGFSLH